MPQQCLHDTPCSRPQTQPTEMGVQEQTTARGHTTMAGTWLWRTARDALRFALACELKQGLWASGEYTHEAAWVIYSVCTKTRQPKLVYRIKELIVWREDLCSNCKLHTGFLMAPSSDICLWKLSASFYSYNQQQAKTTRELRLLLQQVKKKKLMLSCHRNYLITIN